MFLWLCCAVIALWMGLRHIPTRWDMYRPLPELIALIPLLWIPTLVILAIAIAYSSWSQGVIAVLLLCIQLLWHSIMYVDLPKPLLRICGVSQRRNYHKQRPELVSSTNNAQETATELSTSVLHVMSLNCRFGRADAQSIRKVVTSNHVDVLALQEVTPELLDALESAGVHAELPFTVTGTSRDDDNGGSNALLLRYEPSESSESSINLPAAAVPAATLSINGRKIRFASVHPKSPGRGGRFWHQGISQLGELGNYDETSYATDSSNISLNDTVVLGDLNSSMYHPVFRQMLQNSRFLDSSYELCDGYHRTFPSSWKGVPALIELDHVLFTPGVYPIKLVPLAIPGSDHRAVLATLGIV